MLSLKVSFFSCPYCRCETIGYGHRMKTIYHPVLRDTNGYIRYNANRYLCKGCGNLKTNKRIGRNRGPTIKSSNIKGHSPHEFHAKKVLFVHSHQPDSLEMDFTNQPDNLYYQYFLLYLLKSSKQKASSTVSLRNSMSCETMKIILSSFFISFINFDILSMFL